MVTFSPGSQVELRRDAVMPAQRSWAMRDAENGAGLAGTGTGGGAANATMGTSMERNSETVCGRRLDGMMWYSIEARLARSRTGVDCLSVSTSMAMVSSSGNNGIGCGVGALHAGAALAGAASLTTAGLHPTTTRWRTLPGRQSSWTRRASATGRPAATACRGGARCAAPRGAVWR